MRFADVVAKDEPAYEIFKAALEAVFDSGDNTTEHIQRLSTESRLVYLLWCFDGEIHNGGFDQFFTNSSGNYCLEVLDGLIKVGATRSHELLSKALVWFPNSSPSADRTERWEQYKRFSENQNYQSEMEALDQEFYKYEDGLASLLDSYVSTHPNATLLA